MFYHFFFRTILSMAYSLIVVTDLTAWKLRHDMAALAILYSVSMQKAALRNTTYINKLYKFIFINRGGNIQFLYIESFILRVNMPVILLAGSCWDWVSIGFNDMVPFKDWTSPCLNVQALGNSLFCCHGYRLPGRPSSPWEVQLIDFVSIFSFFIGYESI